MSKTSRLGAAKTIQPVVVAAGGLALDSSVVYLVNQALDDANDWWIRVTGKGFSIGPTWWGRTWRAYPHKGPNSDDIDFAPGQVYFARSVIDDLGWPKSPERAYVMVVCGSGGLAGQVPLDLRGESPLVLLGDAFVQAICGNKIWSNKIQGLPSEHIRGTEAAQVGALCHELGHLVLGSPHDSTDVLSIMGAEFDQWPRVGLTGEELQRAAMSGWLF